MSTNYPETPEWATIKDLVTVLVAGAADLTLSAQEKATIIDQVTAILNLLVVPAQPVLSGTEVVTDGGFETGVGSFSPNANCTIAQVAGGYSGSACEMTATSPGSPKSFHQNMGTLTAGKCYILSFRAKDGSLTSKNTRASLYGASEQYTDYIVTSSVWQQTTKIIQVPDTMAYTLYVYYEGTNFSGTLLFDDVSVQEVVGYQDIDSIAIKDLPTILIQITDLLISSLDRAIIQDVTTVILNTLVSSTQDSSTIKDIATILFDQLAFSSQDISTIKDVVTTYVQGGDLASSLFDKATIQDILTIVLSFLLFSSQDSSTIKDQVTAVLDALVNSSTERITISDISTVLFDSLIRYSSEYATIKDVPTLLLSSDVLFSVIERITIRDQITVLLDNLIQSSQDVTSVQDQMTVLLASLIQSSQDSLTIRDQVTLVLDSLVSSSVDRLTLRDVIYVLIPSGLEILTSFYDQSLILDLVTARLAPQFFTIREGAAGDSFTIKEGTSGDSFIIRKGQ